MIVTLDFETEPIVSGPPKPVGVALKENNEPAFYMAWGHPTENNCSWQDAQDTLTQVYNDVYRGAQLVMHNAKFDLAIADRWFGLRPPPNIQDTMIEAFLLDPYSGTLGLKQLAERYLNIPPEERDAVVEWLCANLCSPEGKKLQPTPKSKNYAGAYIGYAPGNLVGAYAIGDVDRTFKLHIGIMKYIEEAGMSQALKRELDLIPLLIENEARGMRIDTERAEEAYQQAADAVNTIDTYIQSALNQPELNVGSTKQLGPALSDAGLLDNDKLLKTEKGNDSFNAESLELALPSPWSKMIKYRRNMLTVGNTFVKNWLEQARETDGIVRTSWNQVAHESNGEGVGARTGRFSSTPSFMNIPKRVGAVEAPVEVVKLLGVELPAVPYVRSLIIPWMKGWYLIGRDYSQQEVRILAHVGEGELLNQYRKDPWFDVYDFVLLQLSTVYGVNVTRDMVKTVVLGIMYGRGSRALGEALNVEREVAERIKQSVFQIIPELDGMFKEVEIRAANDQPVRTWGGRLYFCEPHPGDTKSRRRRAYKLVNYIIQPSAADCTKQAWLNIGKDRDNFKAYLSVHDEFLASVPAEYLYSGMQHLKYSMESVPFDVAMLSEGKYGAANWASMVPFDKKGVDCAAAMG